ncbi:quinol monooxygenase YgiN [Sinorhizobium terangae]|uniref:Antibiotic biosynthesis monooxygenase n=1 Tax=Sinorhizobium terangae TaxID=110322 RepID=A0A6N7LMK5_SINTE|nr:antibiotic biosynthesis monooxygenase family protein [Sinorhizobium terangae]MBB4188449.1 quinol monooxygenase YgiN [Sinorhizobium terangae]MQX18085.1 antibiotic biosynthesis monooxygenase [Sinorhizobium terangae]
MIVEVAEITIKSGCEAQFEAGVSHAARLFLRAKGCHGVALHRVVETPAVYRLLVDWETVEDHMVGFRNSEDFQEWRRLVSPYFDGAPKVTHSEPVALSSND